MVVTMIILVSKFYFHDPKADYLTVITIATSSIDIISDIITINSMSITFPKLFALQIAVITIVFLINVSFAVYILRKEFAKNPAFAMDFTSRYRIALFIAPFTVAKVNALSTLSSKLFSSKTNVFDMQWSPRLERSLIKVAIVSLLMEDITQISIMAYVRTFMSEWTDLNLLKVIMSCLIVTLSVAHGLYKLKCVLVRDEHTGSVTRRSTPGWRTRPSATSRSSAPAEHKRKGSIEL
jgi:hypothetical protein